MSETLMGVLLGGSLTGLVTLAGLILNNRHTRRLEAERAIRETVNRRQDAVFDDCGAALVVAAHLQTKLPLMANRLRVGEDPFDDLLEMQLEWQSCQQRIGLALPEVPALGHLAQVVGVGVNAVHHTQALDWGRWRADMEGARDAARAELKTLLDLPVWRTATPARPQITQVLVETPVSPAGSPSGTLPTPAPRRP